MFATAAAVRKVIESDGRRRLFYNGPKNVFLPSSSSALSSRIVDGLAPTTNDGVCIYLRPYASHSAQPGNSSSCIDKIKDDGSSGGQTTIPSSVPSLLSFSSTRVQSVSPVRKSVRYLPTKTNQLELGFPLQSTSMRSHRFLYNSQGPKLHLYSPYPYEPRAFLSSTPSPSSSESSPSSTERTRNRTAKIPIPKSSPTLSTSMNPLASIDFKAIGKGSLDMTMYVTKTVFKFMIRLPGNIWFYATRPKERREKISDIKELIKKEVDHYWVGIKVSLVTSRATAS